MMMVVAVIETTIYLSLYLLVIILLMDFTTLLTFSLLQTMSTFSLMNS